MLPPSYPEIATAEHLTPLFRKHAGAIAHAAVDLQKRWLQKNGSTKIADYIVNDFAKALADFAIRTYWIYKVEPGETWPDSNGGPFKVEIPEHDRTLIKPFYSAFRETDFDAMLEKNGTKVLILTGFKYLYCLLETARDALNRGYQVVIPIDCTDYAWEDRATRELFQMGAILTTSRDLLDSLPSLSAP
jgi:nicotinamidase-related amidase